MLRRVLIGFSSKPPIVEYLRSAFGRRGIEVRGLFADENTLFDRFVIHRVNKLAHNFRIIPKSRHFFERHPRSHLNFRSARLRAAISEWNPDLVFLIRGLSFEPWAFEHARARFGWWVESDERIAEALSEVALFNRYFFINSSSVEAARRAGFGHCSYLPHAVDASAFRRLELRKDIDFCFVGLWSEKRQRYIEAALEVTQNGAIYGPKWWRKTLGDSRFWHIVKGRYIGGDALVRLYNRTKVVINVTNWGAKAGLARSGMTMRLFEVPATGTLLLTDHSAELERTVNPGKHVATFSGPEEFKDKLRYYLENDAARETIAAEGMRHVQQHHSYDRMVDDLITAYEKR